MFTTAIHNYINKITSVLPPPGGRRPSRAPRVDDEASCSCGRTCRLGGHAAFSLYQLESSLRTVPAQLPQSDTTLAKTSPTGWEDQFPEQVRPPHPRESEFRSARVLGLGRVEIVKQGLPHDAAAPAPLTTGG